MTFAMLRTERGKQPSACSDEEFADKKFTNEAATRPSVQAIWNGSSPVRVSVKIAAPIVSGPGSKRD